MPHPVTSAVTSAPFEMFMGHLISDSETAVSTIIYCSIRRTNILYIISYNYFLFVNNPGAAAIRDTLMYCKCIDFIRPFLRERRNAILHSSRFPIIPRVTVVRGQIVLSDLSAHIFADILVFPTLAGRGTV